MSPVPTARRFTPPPPASLAAALQGLFADAGCAWLVKRIDSGHNDGGCLLVAQALKAILPGSHVVTMVNAGDREPGMPEHYGVRWQDWYFDGNGGFPSVIAWINHFDSKNPGTIVTVIDRFKRFNRISNYSWHRRELIAFLKNKLSAKP